MITYKYNIEKDWHEVREKVFVKEQGFRNEFDDVDRIAEHVCIYVDSVLAGCGRCFAQGVKDVYVIGRIAVLKEFRNSGIGTLIVEKLEEIAQENKAKVISLDAQCQAIHFYEKKGYVIYGEEHMDEHVPHVCMRKKISTLKEDI
ncbi:MAG: GNAT family N-acetyltransferase [Longicatena sp.]